MTTHCLRVVVIFGFAITQLHGEEDDDVLLVCCCHFWFCCNEAPRRKGQHKISRVITLFFPFSYNAI